MSDLVPAKPEENEDFSHFVSNVSKVSNLIPGLYEAIYETLSLYWTDPVKRKRRLNNLKAEFHLAEEQIKGQKYIENISATLAKQVLEPAMEEDREELQKLWAALLAQILVGKTVQVRKEIIDLIKKFDPIDAFLLEEFSEQSLKNNIYNGSIIKFYDLLKRKHENKILFDKTDLMMSLRSLYANDLIMCPSPINFKNLNSFSNNSFSISEIGKKIVLITSPPKQE